MVKHNVQNKGFLIIEVILPSLSERIIGLISSRGCPYLLPILQEQVGKPSEPDSVEPKISSKTSRGKLDSTKRHHQRHYQRVPGEQQFSIHMITV